jgi:hypothetical protein
MIVKPAQSRADMYGTSVTTMGEIEEGESHTWRLASVGNVSRECAVGDEL